MKILIITFFLFTHVNAQESAGAYATQLTPGNFAAYIFYVKFDKNIAPTAQIEINFPIVFNLSKTVIAASKALDGGLAISVEKNVVRLKRTGASKTIPEGTVIDLRLASILNPVEMENSWEFKFSLLNNQQSVDEKLVRATINKMTSR